MRYICNFHLGFHTTRNYLAKAGTLKDMGDLDYYRLIGLNRKIPFIRVVVQRMRAIDFGNTRYRNDFLRDPSRQ